MLLEVATVLHDAGAAAVRTCGSVAQALDMIEAETFSAAILDVRLGHETIATVARKLQQSGTPFVFYTGQLATESTVAQWPHAPIVSKPAPPAQLIDAIVGVLPTTERPEDSQDPPHSSGR